MEDIGTLLDDGCRYKKANKKKFDDSFKDFLCTCGIAKIFKEDAKYLHVGCCESTVHKIIDQVRKRRLYFYIYHNIDGINELKEMSLYCFWVLKWQPFFWKDMCDGRTNNKLNAIVAMRLFTKGLSFYVDEKNNKGDSQTSFKANLTVPIFNTLHYSFQHRDWSKEALMDLAESMVIVEETQKNNKHEA